MTLIAALLAESEALRLHVADVMHTGDEVAWVGPGDTLRQVAIAMTERPPGAACVVTEPHGELLGLVTDGDLRRNLRAFDVLSALDGSGHCLGLLRPHDIHHAETA